VAKAEEQSVPQLQLSLDETQESSPARPSRGFSWGTVVHGALAAAADGGLPRESLARICHGLLVENERPVDANGKPAELDELMALIETLSSSDLWRRARASERLVVEMPFSTLTPQRTQAGGDPSAGPSLYVEGVIDLAFMEADGWAIADYKTDVGTDPGFPARHDSYRKQVDLYAECWSLLTGEAVKERILFYTTQQRLEIW
jgi:ATP-dependent exoDNAse (exonuclease V) beta subunit